MSLTGEAIGRFVFIICFRIFPRFQPFLMGLEDFLGELEDFVFVFVFLHFQDSNSSKSNRKFFRGLGNY